MKHLLFLALLLLAAPAAFAVINPEDNVIGPYFDTEADVDCVEGIELNTQLIIYIILTRPTYNEIYGFELGLEFGSDLIKLDHNFASSQAVNVGSGDSFIVGFGSPIAAEEATLLMTLTMLNMGTINSPTSFIISGSDPSSLDPDYPTILLADSEMVSTGLHSEFRPLTYQINGRCSFEDEERTWDDVKSLYRR